MALAEPGGRQRQHGHVVQILARLPQAQRRAQRPAQAGCDQAQQRVGGVELVAARRLHAHMAQEALDLLADHRTLAVADQRQAAGQLRQLTRRLQRAHRVRAREHRHPRFGAQQPRHDARVVDGRVGADREVQLAPAQLLDQHRRQPGPHQDLLRRARHRADQPRPHGGRERVDAAEVDMRVFMARGGAHLVDHRARLGQQLGGALAQRAAGVGGDGGAHLAVEQLQFEFGLQRLDRLADGALAQAQQLGGHHHRTRVAHRHEGFERVQVGQPARAAGVAGVAGARGGWRHGQRW